MPSLVHTSHVSQEFPTPRASTKSNNDPQFDKEVPIKNDQVGQSNVVKAKQLLRGTRVSQKVISQGNAEIENTRNSLASQKSELNRAELMKMTSKDVKNN